MGHAQKDMNNRKWLGQDQENMDIFKRTATRIRENMDIGYGHAQKDLNN